MTTRNHVPESVAEISGMVRVHFRGVESVWYGFLKTRRRGAARSRESMPLAFRTKRSRILERLEPRAPQQHIERARRVAMR